MNLIENNVLSSVSGGMIGAPPGSPLLSVDSKQPYVPGGDFNDRMQGFSTYTYDDGSTISTNGRGDVIGYSEIPSRLDVDWGNCLQFAGGAGATALSSGWAAVFSGLATIGAGISCYNGSSVGR